MLKRLLYLSLMITIPFIETSSAVTLTTAQYSRSVTRTGNLARLQRAFDKGRRGEPLVIGAIGGSITQGYAASTASNRYANRVQQWWQAAFPSSSVTLKNAGIGATSSLFGAHRVQGDLLAAQPDFVVIDFAVNDGGISGKTNPAESMEGIIRQALNSAQSPAVMLLFMMEETGRNVQDLHAPVGAHYDLPMISYRDAFWTDVQSGALAWSSIAADQVHPNNTGHEYCAELITHFLQAQLQAYSGTAGAIPAVPAPTISDVFEHTARLNASSLTVGSNNGWWKEGTSWVSATPGNEIVFQVPGTCQSLLWYVIKGATGYAEFSVDDRTPVEYDGWFSGTWGGYSQAAVIDKDLGSGTHNLKATIMNKKDPESTGYRFEIKEIMVAGLSTGTQTVATPSISPNGGSHDGAVQVTLSTATAGAQIRYTTNGSSPTSSSTLYSAPFSISAAGATTVKAKAFKSGMDDSNEASATFTITIDTDAPTITSATAAGTPTSVQVTFNEQLDETSAETAGNYAVNNGISVTGAALQSDGRTVLLTTGTLSEDVIYTLTVNNVEDFAGNKISTNAQTTFGYLDAIPDMGAWWKFNETGGTTALDASGNGNDATVNGATRVAGIAGSALSFDGVDDYVDAGTFDPSTGDMTIAAWLNWKGTNDAHQVVIAKRDGWDAAEMRWQLARSYISNKVAFQQKNSSALFATDFPSTDAWFHVAVIKSGSTVKIYFDGVEAGSSSMDFGTKTDARIYLGSSGTGSESFNGMLDDVRIYNRALAVSELAAVMDTSTSSGIDTTVSVITASVPAVQQNAVTVTPNPVSSYAIFKLPSTIRGNAHISIFNGSGELVNAFTVNGSKGVWNGTDQYGAVATPGVYLYRMQSGSTVMNGMVYKTN